MDCYCITQGGHHGLLLYNTGRTSWTVTVRITQDGHHGLLLYNAGRTSWTVTV